MAGHLGHPSPFTLHYIQVLGVEVIPGCEECRFKIIATVRTNAPPLIEIYRANSNNSEEQDLTPSNFITGQFASENGLSFDERVSGLKQGAMYRYRVQTIDTSGHAQTIGTFTTARRSATGCEPPVCTAPATSAQGLNPSPMPRDCRNLRFQSGPAGRRKPFRSH